MPRAQPAPTAVASPLRRRSHAERSASTRAQLLGAAADLVRGGGVQAASMFEVAKAAGVTPGALQHHFGSKAELMMQVIEHILRSDDASGVAWPAPSMPLARRCVAFRRRAVGHGLRAAALHHRLGHLLRQPGRPDLMQRIGVRRQLLQAELRQRFVAVFPELAPRPALAADLADLVFASLRGLAMVRLFDENADPGTGVRRELAASIEARCRLAPPARRVTAAPAVAPPRSSTPLRRKA
jgi:AcrR family transcriptional regulator